MRGLGQSQRRVQTWGQKVAQDLNKTFRGAMSGLAGLAGFGGVATLAIQAKKVMDFEDSLQRLGIAARIGGAQLDALRDQIDAAATATGVQRDQLLAGVHAYVALTGDVTTATESLEVFAKAAQATGTPMEEIAATAAALKQNLGITSAEMEAALSGIHSQGKSGAVEFKEMAAIVTGLAPRFATFNTTGVKGLQEMNGLLQTMRIGFGTTSEAATSLEAIMGALTDSSTIKKLEAIGVKAYTTDAQGVRHMRDLRDILVDTIAATKGDPITISKIFGRKEAVAGIVKLTQAGADEIDRMITEAGRAGELAQDFAKIADTPAVKIAKAKAKLDAAFSQVLIKHLDKIVLAFEKLTDLLDWMLSHSTAVLAMFAAIKGGDYLSSFGGAAGVGGRGGALEAAMNMRAGATRSGRAALIGGGLRGAAYAYGAYQLSGEMGLKGFERGVVTVGAGLAALPGPLGAFGTALVIGTSVIKGFFASLEADIEARNQKIAAGHYGQFGMDRAREFEASQMALDKVRQGVESGALPEDALRTAEENRDQKSAYLLQRAKEVGALSPELNDGQFTGRFKLNERVLAKALAKEDLNPAQRKQLAADTAAAVGLTEDDKDVGNYARRLFGIKENTGGAIKDVRVEVGIKVIDGNITATVENNRQKRRRAN